MILKKGRGWKSFQTVINFIVVEISAKPIKECKPAALVTARILECLPDSKTFSRQPGECQRDSDPALGLTKTGEGKLRKVQFRLDFVS